MAFFLIEVTLALEIVGSFLVFPRPDTDPIPVVQDSQALFQFHLVQAENQIIEVEYESRSNRIEIKDHKIRMLEAGG